MKFITNEELSAVMPMFVKFAEKSGFAEKMDSFMLFKSLEVGLSRGGAVILVNDSMNKMVFARFLNAELENKSKQMGINAAWSDLDDDPWIKEAITYIVENKGKPAGVEEYYVNVYTKSNKIYSSLSDNLTEYETANKLVM